MSENCGHFSDIGKPSEKCLQLSDIAPESIASDQNLACSDQALANGQPRDKFGRQLEVRQDTKAQPFPSVGVFEAEDFRIVAGLLNGVGRRFVTGLRLDHGKRKVPRKAQQVINPLGRLAYETLANRETRPSVMVRCSAME